MNIPAILGLGFTTLNRNAKLQRQNYDSRLGITMLSPLTQDTVSFKSTKTLENRTYGISLQAAMGIHEEVSAKQVKIVRFIKKLFDDLIADEFHPTNPLKAIGNRVKKPLSIVEKSATRQWNSKAEVLDFMTDLNGIRLIMRDASRSVVDRMLERLIPLIKTGALELIEIENKRPAIVKGLPDYQASEYDYASINMLEKLIQVQEDTWNGKGRIGKERLVSQNLTGDFTDANYCAIHFLMRIPGKASRVFECQLIGEHEEQAKRIDDLLFKILNNKEIEEKYRPIADLFKSIKIKKSDSAETKKEKQRIIDLLNKYRAEVMLSQRKKEPQKYSPKETIAYFPVLQYDIPKEYDFNNLSILMEICDANAAKAAKNTRKK